MRGLQWWIGGVAILLWTQAAAAQGERPLREARSENRRFLLRVEPGQAGRAGRSCTASLLEEGERGRVGRKVWERALVNEAAPTRAAVRNDGRFVVTLDEYRRGGARNALVIYGSEGELLRHFLLSDLLDKDDWPHVQVNRRELSWLKDARLAFDDPANAFTIELAWGRKVRIDLRTLQVVCEGERAGIRLTAIPPEILAQLLGHLEGGDGPVVAQKLPEVTGLTPEEQAQAAAIGQQLSTQAGAQVPAATTEPADQPTSAEAPAVEQGASAAVAASGEMPAESVPEAVPGSELAVPPPNPAQKVDYVTWFNDLGRVDGPDANPVYEAAIAQLVPWTGEPDVLPAAARGDPVALSSPEMIAWLNANAGALAKFREASEYAEKGWARQSLDGSMINILLPEMASMRALARGTLVEGQRLAITGHPAEAAERYLDVLAAGAHVGGGLTLIENLVGVAMQGPAADALLDLEAKPAGDKLDYTALAGEAEAAYRPTRSAAEAIQAERAFFMDAVQRTWDVDPQTGACVPNAAEVKKLLATVEGMDDARLAAFQDEFARAGYEETVTAGNLFYDALADAVSRPYPQATKYLAQIEDVVRGSTTANPFLREMMPSLPRYVFLKTRAETTRRATLLVTNLQAYRQQQGEYPPSLDAFAGREAAVDPFSNVPFVYRRSGDGFVLYSVGGNGVDDAGVHDGKGDTGDIVIWPRPKR